MARRRGCLPTSVGRWPGRHGSRRALRTRTVLGCSFWKSVAEVGKKHLPSRTPGEPRGELKLRPGSTSRRRSPDKKRHPGTGERVRACRAIITVNATRLTRLQDRGSRRRKASWVWVFATLKRRGGAQSLARRSSRLARRKSDEAVANASGGAHAVALSGDRGRQRLRHQVRLSQPKGAGGQVAADCTLRTCNRAAPGGRGRSCRG